MSYEKGGINDPAPVEKTSPKWNLLNPDSNPEIMSELSDKYHEENPERAWLHPEQYPYKKPLEEVAKILSEEEFPEVEIQKLILMKNEIIKDNHDELVGMEHLLKKLRAKTTPTGKTEMDLVAEAEFQAEKEDEIDLKKEFIKNQEEGIKPLKSAYKMIKSLTGNKDSEVNIKIIEDKLSHIFGLPKMPKKINTSSASFTIAAIPEMAREISKSMKAGDLDFSPTKPYITKRVPMPVYTFYHPSQNYADSDLRKLLKTPLYHDILESEYKKSDYFQEVLGIYNVTPDQETSEKQKLMNLSRKV